MGVYFVGIMVSDYGDCRGNERNANVLEYGKNRKDYQVMIQKIGLWMFEISAWLFCNYILIRIMNNFIDFNAEFVFLLIVVNAMIIGLLMMGWGI